MNHESIEDLFARWQQNPDPARTVALCEALRDGSRPDLVEIVGSHASRQLDVGALLAAARMYTDAGRLDEAQSVLLSAGRIAPREADVYRWLGEVLLRRGDAERAEKVLEKAVQFGADGIASSLLERARALVPVQRTSGQQAVAAAVAAASSPRIPAPKSNRDATRVRRDPPSDGEMTVPRRDPPSDGEVTVPRRDPPSDRDVTLQRREAKRVGPPDPEDDVETAIRRNDDVKAAIDAALAPLSSSPMPVAGRGRDVPLPLPDDLVFTTPTRGVGFEVQRVRDDAIGSGGIGPDDLVSDMTPLPTEPRAARAATAGFGAPEPPLQRDSDRALRARAEDRPVNPLLLKSLERPPVTLGGATVPEPRDVLDALQIAGIYEPDALAGPQRFEWAKPEKAKRVFHVYTLVGLAVVLVGVGIGTYFYVTNQRAKAHVEVEQLLAEVDRDLRAGEAARLGGAEKSISRAFELESRSPHAALTWLHERAAVGLLKGGADLAFEDAVQRAKVVGVEDKRIAFAHVASFLFQGDTAGAAAMVAKWDSVAQDDPWFLLLSGATFERAGDPRALERYAAAAKLDPELVIAHVLLGRAMAIDGDHRRAAELAKDFRTRYPTRPEGAALAVLAWTRDPLRGEPPAEIKNVTENGDALPVSLRAVPHAARAILALYRGAIDEARPSVQKGLDVADTPGMAAWLGSIALVMGDENLARKAALAAVSFSAVYPPARVLAARVALLGARLDEALKAIEDLPPDSLDVAIVAAAASYEKLDGERMSRAFDALPEEAKNVPFAIPLVHGQALLAGNLRSLTSDKVVGMANDEAPWADLVAMDWALDAGDIELAKKIAEQWRGETRALRAIRLARLARYEGRLEDADKYSRIALESGTITMRALAERVFTLVAAKRDADALALFKTYPNVGGPLSKWLRAYATAAHGKADEARAIVSQEDPPPAAAPMAARIITAAAYGAMKDVRHGKEYTVPIVQAGFTNPDVAYAAERLGMARVMRRR
jgi:tetratricopeptide (TPR) repeat protein